MAYRRPNGAIRYKVVVMGDQYCGKTSIIERYIQGEFPTKYIQTQAAEYYCKDLAVEGRHFKLTVFDTAGQETLKTIIRSLYRNAHGILLVFDFSRAETLRHIKDWMELIKTNCDNMPEVVISGNKLDLREREREVTPREGADMAKLLGVKYFDVSAKNDYNIHEAFEALVRQIVESRGLIGNNALLRGAVSLEEEKGQTSGCC